MRLNSIVVSRTDSIGDVTLTLPVCGAIKRCSPRTKVMFLCSAYTLPIVRACRWVDEAHIWPGPIPSADAIVHVFPRREIARAALHIPLRVGTYSRWYHWTTCNRPVRLHRKRSRLHEIELNLKLLRPLFPDCDLPEASELYGLEVRAPLPPDFESELRAYAAGRPVVLLHPKSKGSAREWPASHWRELHRLLCDGGYAPVVTGVEAEKQAFVRQAGNDFFFAAGRLDLDALMRLMVESEGLIAASTGPLHISAALGRKALGIYPPMRPMHPGRWGPRGPRARALALDRDCRRCRKSVLCDCVRAISPQAVFEAWRTL
ncbi:MAG: glycosyltransferase family 9 protein [Bacteroidia bacterium]|nr:glycosyltransferase family 9 protein [Bacteroidia bacterium]